MKAKGKAQMTLEEADNFQEKFRSEYLKRGNANEKLERMSQAKALLNYKKTKKLINKGKNETLKQLVEEMDQAELTAKEKLQTIHARSDNKHLLRSLIVEMVARAGGVKNFLKRAKEKLDHKDKKDERKKKNKPRYNDSVDWGTFSQMLSIVSLIMIGVVFGPEFVMAYLTWELISIIVCVELATLILIIVAVSVNNSLNIVPEKKNEL